MSRWSPQPKLLSLHGAGTISVNSRRTPFTASGESEILDLEGDMYLGGLPTDRTNLILPTELWTAMLNYGYVGCIRDLFIDGRSKDIRQIAEAQNGAGIKPSCNKQPGKQCESYPCKNRGVCKEGWNRFICDCTGTGYWSRTCERGKYVATWFAFLYYLYNFINNGDTVALLQGLSVAMDIVISVELFRVKDMFSSSISSVSGSGLVWVWTWEGSKCPQKTGH